MYGNDQVSKQQVILAADVHNLSFPNKSVMGAWLSACDPTSRGIYNIQKLCQYLERSQPHILEMRNQHSASLSKSRSSY